MKPRRMVGAARAWVAQRDWVQAFLWGALSASALPPVHALPALLFAVPALLRLIGRAPSIARLFGIAWCYGFGLGLAGLYWITEPVLTEVSTFWWLVPFAAPLMAAAVACYAIPPALAAWFCQRPLPRLLVFAGSWVVSNLAQQFMFSGFPWNFWGTDWAVPGGVGNVMLQPAALVSVHGLTLATLLLAGLPMFGRRGLVALLAALGLWAGYGGERLKTPVTMTGVNLALVQPDFAEPPEYSRAGLEQSWATLLNMSRAAINAGADAVVWPEGSSPWLLPNDVNARAQLAQVTGTTPVLAGTLREVSPDDIRNSLAVMAGPVPPLAIYDKWKLVPFGEYTPKWIPLKIIPALLGQGFTAGTGPETISAAGLPPFGAEICYEDVFPGEMVDEAHRPDWILAVTDDAWFGDSAGPRQHFANARLRAVEEGLPFVRDANSGESAVIDPLGRVTASLPLDYKGVLVAPLPGPLAPTLFSRLGLGLPLMLALAVILAGVLTSRLTRHINFEIE